MTAMRAVSQQPHRPHWKTTLDGQRVVCGLASEVQAGATVSVLNADGTANKVVIGYVGRTFQTKREGVRLCYGYGAVPAPEPEVAPEPAHSNGAGQSSFAPRLPFAEMSLNGTVRESDPKRTPVQLPEPVARPVLVHTTRLPRSLATDSRYHALRTSDALDTIVAMAVLTDGVTIDHDDQPPIEIHTTATELRTTVGLEGAGKKRVTRGLDILANTYTPDGDLLVCWERGKGDALTIIASPWWGQARSDAASPTHIAPSAYASLEQAIERRCYVWLAGWVGINGATVPRQIDIKKLGNHLYAAPPDKPFSTMNRRIRARTTLAILNALPGHGWGISEADDLVTVAPRVEGARMPAADVDATMPGQHMHIVPEAHEVVSVTPHVAHAPAVEVEPPEDERPAPSGGDEDDGRWTGPTAPFFDDFLDIWEHHSLVKQHRQTAYRFYAVHRERGVSDEDLRSAAITYAEMQLRSAVKKAYVLFGPGFWRVLASGATPQEQMTAPDAQPATGVLHQADAAVPADTTPPSPPKSDRGVAGHLALVARVGGQQVRLAEKQLALLACFAGRTGEVLTYEYLHQQVFGPDGPRRFPGALASIVFDLRRRLEEHYGSRRWLQNVRHTGYRFVGPEITILPMADQPDGEEHEVRGVGSGSTSTHHRPTTNSLAALRPDLIAQWDFEANGDLTPDTVPANTHKRVHWVCPFDPSHHWEGRVDVRTRSREWRCPLCIEERREQRRSRATGRRRVQETAVPQAPPRGDVMDQTTSADETVQAVAPEDLDVRRDASIAADTQIPPGTAPYAGRLTLSVAEAAAALGVSRTLVNQECVTGRLHSVKIGQRRLIPVASLEAWLGVEVGPAT